MNSRGGEDMGVTAIQRKQPLPSAADIEQVLVGGDLSKLNAEQRVSYYMQVCQSVGLNHLTRPLEYMQFQGKLQLYARKDCTDQLRKIHSISVKIISREKIDDLYVVQSQTSLPSGREDEALGAVSINGLKGESLANAMMKAETKSKRRATLSICGLGILDETEIESIQQEQVQPTIQRKSEAKSEAKAETPTAEHVVVEFISDTERKRFFELCKVHGKTEEEIKKQLWLLFGSSNTAEITKDKYDDLCKWAEQK